MDKTIRNLARRAGEGDLNAAKQLVRYLERIGAQHDEDWLIIKAHQILSLNRRADYSGEHSDTEAIVEAGHLLASDLLNYFDVPEPNDPYRPTNGVVLTDGSVIGPPDEYGVISKRSDQGALKEERLPAPEGTPEFQYYWEWRSMFFRWPPTVIGDDDEMY